MIACLEFVFGQLPHVPKADYSAAQDSSVEHHRANRQYRVLNTGRCAATQNAARFRATLPPDAIHAALASGLPELTPRMKLHQCVPNDENGDNCADRGQCESPHDRRDLP
jgi:hypothetical protein